MCFWLEKAIWLDSVFLPSFLFTWFLSKVLLGENRCWGEWESVLGVPASELCWILLSMYSISSPSSLLSRPTGKNDGLRWHHSCLIEADCSALGNFYVLVSMGEIFSLLITPTFVLWGYHSPFQRAIQSLVLHLKTRPGLKQESYWLGKPGREKFLSEQQQAESECSLCPGGHGVA